MQIFVDADACPTACKEILYRLAERRQLQLILVANVLLRVPGSRFIRALQVPAGMDAADDAIVQMVVAGDLVITADIPLAAQVLERQGFALHPRGEFFTSDNIAEQLSMRSMLEQLRSGGIDTGGPPPFSLADRRHFANQLDRHLARYAR